MAMLLAKVGGLRLIDDHRNAELPYQVVGLDNRTLALLADRVLAEAVLNYLEEDVDRFEHALSDPFVPTDQLTVDELKACERRLKNWFDTPEKMEA